MENKKNITKIKKHLNKHLKKGIQHIQKARKRGGNWNIIITVGAIIMIWRGIWGILDKILFPNNEMVSYIVSVAIGILILWIEDKKIKELIHH